MLNTWRSAFKQVYSLKTNPQGLAKILISEMTYSERNLVWAPRRHSIS
jgi:hypothetical protein